MNFKNLSSICGSTPNIYLVLTHIKTSGLQWYDEHLRKVRRKNLTDDDLLTTFRGRGVGGGGGGWLRVTYQIFVYPSSYKQILPLPVLVGADLRPVA